MPVLAIYRTAFRARSWIASRRDAFRYAGAASTLLLPGLLWHLSARTFDTDRAAAQLDAYNAYDYRPFYRFGSCFAPAGGTFDDSCVGLSNRQGECAVVGRRVLAGILGLSEHALPLDANILQVTQPACMPTFEAAAQGYPPCRSVAAQMQAYFGDHKPDLVILSADWLEYARPPRFEEMIADLKATIARLNASGIRVVLLGPAVQFKSRVARDAAARADWRHRGPRR